MLVRFVYFCLVFAVFGRVTRGSHVDPQSLLQIDVNTLHSTEALTEYVHQLRNALTGLLNATDEHGTCGKPQYTDVQQQPTAKEKHEEQKKHCLDYLECDSCFANGCAWCVGERICVPDEIWMCQGQEDQVSNVYGAVKQCPAPNLDTKRKEKFKVETNSFCSKWKHEAKCNDDAPIGSDQDCNALIRPGSSGYCECEDGRTAAVRDCSDTHLNATFRCSEVCYATRLQAGLGCVSWRQTGNCDAHGPREPQMDLACSFPIPSTSSGFCECEDGIEVGHVGCDHESFTCEEMCGLSENKKRREEFERVRENISHDRVVDEEQAARIPEILKRARAAKSVPGSLRPYEVLAIEETATHSQIRKAYLKLSLLLHPDRNPSVVAEASAAFADVVAAYEVIGDPERRIEFDEGKREEFMTESAYARFGRRDTRGLYGKNGVSEISERGWNSIQGVWFVQLYSAWCPHCQHMVRPMTELAKMLEDNDEVGVGAVNCQVEEYLCRSVLNVRAYPTFRLFDRTEGFSQEYLNPDRSPEAMVAWINRVSSEWKILKRLGVIKHLQSLEPVLSSKDLWIVVYTDGKDCAPCQTAMTNIRRLAGGILGLASVGVVDCTKERTLCDQVDIPHSPHAPQVRLYKAGSNKTEKGENAYHPNLVEPHLAMEMLEKTIRCALADQIKENSLGLPLSEWEEYIAEAESQGHEQQWEWNGPKGRNPVLMSEGAGHSPQLLS
jgi:thiol-disulfide isomerase/thioredoxin